MESERYFIIGDFYGLADDRGQPLENQVLALIDDLTAEEAELIAKAVETVCEESYQATVATLSESKSREDMVQHLVRCTEAAQVRAELANQPANSGAVFYRLARYAVRFSEEVRKLRRVKGAEQVLRRFEVFDEDTAQSIVFDATDTQHWGPEEYGTDWNGEFFECQVEETLYRHASRHWTIISEATHFEAPCSSGKRARRVEEKEAITWLVRYGFSLPDELEKLAAPTFFVPGQPSPPQPQVTETTPIWNRDRCELTYRDTIIKRVRGASVAKNVVRVLDAFQEEGWPDRIDDPLDPSKDQQRLHETIKRLNENLEMIRFHGDGSGTGIQWKLTAPEPPQEPPDTPF